MGGGTADTPPDPTHTHTHTVICWAVHGGLGFGPILWWLQSEEAKFLLEFVFKLLFFLKVKLGHIMYSLQNTTWAGAGIDKVDLRPTEQISPTDTHWSVNGIWAQQPSDSAKSESSSCFLHSLLFLLWNGILSLCPLCYSLHGMETGDVFPVIFFFFVSVSFDECWPVRLFLVFSIDSGSIALTRPQWTLWGDFYVKSAGSPRCWFCCSFSFIEHLPTIIFDCWSELTCDCCEPAIRNQIYLKMKLKVLPERTERAAKSVTVE